MTEKVDGACPAGALLLNIWSTQLVEGTVVSLGEYTHGLCHYPGPQLRAEEYRPDQAFTEAKSAFLWL